MNQNLNKDGLELSDEFDVDEWISSMCGKPDKGGASVPPDENPEAVTVSEKSSNSNQISPVDRWILFVTYRDSTATQNSIGQLIGTDGSTIRKHRKILRTHGFLENDGSRARPRWMLTPKGEDLLSEMGLLDKQADPEDPGESINGHSLPAWF